MFVAVGGYGLVGMATDSGFPLYEAMYYVTVGVVVLAALMFPTGVAFHKHHPHLIWIAIVNLLFGGLIIGWIIALAWALYTPKPEHEVEREDELDAARIEEQRLVHEQLEKAIRRK